MIIMRKSNKKIKLRDRVNIIVSGVLVLLGIFMLVIPFLGYIAPTNLLYILFSVYACIKIIEVIITPKTNDYEDVWTALACALAAISGFKFGSYEPTKVLSITLASWVSIMAVIKLIKLDYYHDRENGLFYVNLVTFSLFILLGLLTSINLYFDETVQILMLGFFFVVNGLLNLAEDGIRILVKTKTISKKDAK